MSHAGRPVLLRWTPQLVALLVVTAGLWLLILDQAGTMGSMPGTTGLSISAFTGMWTLMMAAMMLPSVAPVASLYSRTFSRRRTGRLITFAATYLAAWALTAVPAWLVLRTIEMRLTSGSSPVAVASLVFATVGTWQLSPMRERCLRHCRSPFAQLVHYGSLTGPLPDVQVALRHASYCLGCCWALMALFLVTGTMHLGAMVVLAAIVTAERLLPRSRELTLATGVLALAAAIAVWWVPGIAPGLPDSTPLPRLLVQRGEPAPLIPVPEAVDRASDLNRSFTSCGRPVVGVPVGSPPSTIPGELIAIFSPRGERVHLRT